MWSWIIKVTLISLLLIFLLHYLYSFFKITLTAPKLKDLVNKPQTKYNTIYKSLQSASEGSSVNLGDDETISHNSHNSKPNYSSNSGVLSTSSMKDELKKYLKEISTSGNVGNIEGTSNNKIIKSGNNSIATNNDNTIHTNNFDAQNEITSVYSPANIIGGVGANGISTRVHNTPNFMADSTKSSSSFLPDFGTPSMSSSYSSSYSPY
jgi:hypothetical protein